jgi:biopolymer transport protein ExbB/TolQ
MKKLNQYAAAFTKSPFVWGILGAVGFYSLIHAGPLNIDLVKRYFTKHPVEYMETVMFAVGLAVLICKAFDISGQRKGLRDSLLGSPEKSPLAIEECGGLLARLDRLPARRQNEYYVARTRAALEHVERRGSADALGDELKYLADLDAARSHAGYGLFRVIVWAIPILGFLGTVIGITMALNSVDLQAPDKSMLEVLNGLGLKFDTTALALTLSMILMFVHYSVERIENSLLEQVDRRVQRELAGRFVALPKDTEGQLVAMRKMAETMLQATELLAQRQAELWQTSMDSAVQKWAQMAELAGGEVKAALSTATGELTRQAEVLQHAVEATGEVARLEDALNRNLTALSGAKHFEQTVLSLAAAVNMLSAALAEAPNPTVRLESRRRSAHAA